MHGSTGLNYIPSFAGAIIIANYKHKQDLVSWISTLTICWMQCMDSWEQVAPQVVLRPLLLPLSASKQACSFHRDQGIMSGVQAQLKWQGDDISSVICTKYNQLGLACDGNAYPHED